MAENWLTYRDLSEKLGIKVHSARMRAKRNGWPTRVRNDGVAETLVNLDDLPPKQLKPKKTKKEKPLPIEPPAEIKALENHVQDLQGQVASKDLQLADSSKTIERLQDQISDITKERQELTERLLKKRGLLGFFK